MKHPYAVACQCPVCKCQRPVEAKVSGLAICDRCEKAHYPTER